MKCGLGVLIITLLWNQVQASKGDFRLASYYGNHMVLQRAPARAVIWGFASADDEGAVVSLHLTHPVFSTVQTYYAVVQPGRNSLGEWRVELIPLTHYGPYSITVELGVYKPLHLNDVLVGEVWVCSGQSNMRFKVPKMFNGTEEMKSAHLYPDIRLFSVGMCNSSAALPDLKAPGLQWSLPSNDSMDGANETYFSAVCWLYGRMIHDALGKVPVGLIESSLGATSIEAWSSNKVIKMCNGNRELPDMPSLSPSGRKPLGATMRPSVLWNAMIYPLLNMTIKGVVWYQGEANVYFNNAAYKCTFPAMIQDWRRQWNEASNRQTSAQFPFGFVQIGPSYYMDGNMKNTGFAAIRWHQTSDTGTAPNYMMPNTFMSTAVDTTDLDSPYGPIHPRDKETVAVRLARAGLAVAYGINVGRYVGPEETAFYVDIGFYTLRIEFDNATHPIVVLNKDGFDVCCSHDNTTQCTMETTAWRPVKIVQYTNTSVAIDWKLCSGMWLMGYRYLWRDTPCPYKRCAVYSEENSLPLTPRMVSGIFGRSNNYQKRKVYNVPVSLVYKSTSLS